MAQGTVMPAPKFVGFDDSGNICAGGFLYTYAAGGTVTPLATYSDVDLTVANANPVELDGAGRATVFLSATSYCFVLKDALLNTIWTQDNIAAAAGFSVNLDVAGTLGETVVEGQGVYLSDGSGSKTAGKFYLWDADFTYASTLPVCGVATDGGVLNDVVAIRLLGQATVTGPLTPGATYYISNTAGALSASAGTNERAIGVADTTTSILLLAAPPVVIDFTSADNILANQVFS